MESYIVSNYHISWKRFYNPPIILQGLVIRPDPFEWRELLPQCTLLHTFLQKQNTCKPMFSNMTNIFLKKDKA